MKAIITDYDHTLSDKFLTVELLFLLEKKGVISGYTKEYLKLREDYKNGLKNYNEFVKSDMEFIKKYLKDVNYLDVVKILREDFFPEENIFDWSKEIRKMFNSEEWLFIVISSTLDLCLEKVQDTLKFDTYFCSSYEVIETKFTGNFKCKVASEEKGHYVKHLARDLEKIIVIGDAPGDFEMMKCATRPLLFEPDAHTLKEKGDLDFEVVDRKNILEVLSKEI